MIEIFKKLFGKKKEEEYTPDPPGRTFKRILTGRFFGCEDLHAGKHQVAKAKKDKIEQIKELELIPKFVRFFYDETSEEDSDPISAHVTFQKEVFAEKWNMIHVTEISFTVNSTDFDEFEKMAGVSLTNDFRNLSSTTFNGKDRRTENRDT